VEGISAGGSAKSGRDNEYQAVLPLKGKVINAEKHQEKIFNNQEIKDLITTLGCGIESKFNIQNLMYHKIIITPDADSDGNHICNLLLTFFYRFLRDLIVNEHLYIAKPPLYKFQLRKEKKYLYSDQELAF